VHGFHKHPGGTFFIKAEFLSGPGAQVDEAVFNKGATIVDPNDDPALVFQVDYTHKGGKRQMLVGGTQTAVHYHMFHALGLLAAGLLAAPIPPSAWLRWSGGLMCGGIALFCDSFYVLSVTQWRWLEVVTPLGGLAFILAWALFVMADFKTSA
jgi:uncharacterized membrane protein YgdD (TMEM256/DUF423 family)